MTITYKTNGAATTKSMTEWYFGQGFVKNSTAAAVQQLNTSGKAHPPRSCLCNADEVIP